MERLLSSPMASSSVENARSSSSQMSEASPKDWRSQETETARAEASLQGTSRIGGRPAPETKTVDGISADVALGAAAEHGLLDQRNDVGRLT